ncbi:MAG: plasmid pRiA4b ORF-3 family protein [Burkholderia gladioli]
MQITLNEVEPEISRTIRVASSIRLSELHDIIQTAMGWQSLHRYEFEDGIPPDLPMNTVFHPGQAFEYIYDFGDYWIHTVRIAPTPRRAGTVYPICIEGRRACPPEDCGGPLGYAELLRALRCQNGRARLTLLDARDDDFDPEAFDRDAVNAELRRLFAT